MNNSEDSVIVLAEDDPGHARLIEKSLRATTAGPLIRFENGKDALDYLRSGEQVSLLLLDLNMPVMDGYQVLRRLRADPRTMRIPVIVLTTTDDPIQRCYDLGCTACVVKSADCSQLNETMRRLGLLPARTTPPNGLRLESPEEARAIRASCVSNPRWAPAGQWPAAL